MKKAKATCRKGPCLPYGIHAQCLENKTLAAESHRTVSFSHTHSMLSEELSTTAQ